MNAQAHVDPLDTDINRYIRITDLPEGIRDFARMASLPALIALAQSCPGKSLHITSAPKPDHYFFQVMPEKNARRIFSHYRGCCIRIPTLRTIQMPARNRLILRDYRRGQSIDALCARYQLSDITVWKIIRQND